MAGKGGKRPGAGRPVGSYAFDKERARMVLREKVFARMDAMVDAQIDHACGIKFLIVRDKTTGKFLRVPKDAAEKLKPGEEIAEVYEKDPSVQAFKELVDQTIDKAAQPVTGDLNVNVVGLDERIRGARDRGKRR